MVKRRTPLPALYGICGRKGHGKDTFADLVISSNKNYTKTAFAASLKSICCRVFGFVPEQCSDPKLKEAAIAPVEIDRFVAALRSETSLDIQPRGMTAKSVRQVLQFVGTDYVRSVQNDYWLHRLDAQLGRHPKALVTDVRFPNEAEFLRARGGRIIHIIRIDAETPADTHPSETAEIEADLVLGVRTGDLSLPERAAWLIAIGRFPCAQGYDWRRVQDALAQRRSGLITLQQAAKILGFTGKDSYAVHTVAAYYGETRARLGARNRKPHKVIEGVPCKHCSKCDQWLSLSLFSASSQQWDRLVSHCKKCACEAARARLRNAELTIAGLHARVTRTAKMREIAVEISVDDLQALWDTQGGRCAYTNVPMTMTSGQFLITVDRLDSSLPYTPSNVVLCSYTANMMKRDLTVEEFRLLVEALWNNRANWPKTAPNHQTPETTP